MTFTASPGPDSSSDWAGQGRGSVRVEDAYPSLRFYEQGHFVHASGRKLSFGNVYRFAIEEDRIDLYHERRGVEDAVFLFPLIVTDNNRLASLSPHLCVRDHYSGELVMDHTGFDLIWTVEGPRKQERIHYRYD